MIYLRFNCWVDEDTGGYIQDVPRTHRFHCLSTRWFVLNEIDGEAILQEKTTGVDAVLRR